MARFRPLSPAAQDLLARLQRPPTVFERLVGDRGRVGALDQLVALGEHDLLPRLLPLALNDPVHAISLLVLHRSGFIR